MAITLILVVLCLAVTGCNKPIDEEPMSSETTTSLESDESVEPVETVKITDSYVIVRPDGESEAMIEAAQMIADAIKNIAGTDLSISADSYENENDISSKEIVVGSANRDESRDIFKTLRYDDYVIAVIGEKIIITGGNEEAVLEAAGVFCDTYVTETMEYEEKELFRYSHEYPLDEIQINGVNLKNYTIVFDESEDAIFQSAVAKLKSHIVGICGVELSVARPTDKTAEYEILFGTTDRPESEIVAVTQKTEYGIGFQNSKIVIAASTVFAANAASDEIIAAYFNDTAQKTLLVQIEENSKVEEANSVPDLILLSNNVYASSTAEQRTSLLYETFMEYDADIIGLQECNAVHYSNIVKLMRNEGYAVATATISNKNNAMSYTPILYKKDKYTLIESDCFLYDMRYMETNTKTLSYAVFEDKTDGQIFCIINTHYAVITSTYPEELGTNNVEGSLWREDNSRQLNEIYLEIVDKYEGILVFAMGDFNCYPSSKSYKLLLGNFDDTINAATIENTKGASYHYIGYAPSTDGSPIDHIFVSKDGADILRHHIARDEVALKSTDHCPVIVEIQFK